MIQQELSLVPELAVDENIFLGQEKIRSLFLVDRDQQVRAAREVLQPIGFSWPDRSAGRQTSGRRATIGGDREGAGLQSTDPDHG